MSRRFGRDIGHRSRISPQRFQCGSLKPSQLASPYLWGNHGHGWGHFQSDLFKASHSHMDCPLEGVKALRTPNGIRTCLATLKGWMVHLEKRLVTPGQVRDRSVRAGSRSNLGASRALSLTSPSEHDSDVGSEVATVFRSNCFPNRLQSKSTARTNGRATSVGGRAEFNACLW